MSFQNILAVIDDTSTRSAVIKKSIILANKSQAHLTILNVEKNHTFNLKYLFHKKAVDIKPTNNLEFMREYPVKNNVIDMIECQSHSIHAAVVNECEQHDYDLVVVSHKFYPPFFNEIMISDESHLLSTPDIPIMFVDKNEWQANGHLLTALEFEHTDEEHKELNLHLLNESVNLANLLQNDVHLINCFLNNDIGMAFTPPPEKPHYNDNQLKLATLAKQFRVERQQIHIEQGLVEDIIETMVNKLPANMVILGNAPQHGILRHLKGHTAEYLLNNIKTDVYVIKPLQQHLH